MALCLVQLSAACRRGAPRQCEPLGSAAGHLSTLTAVVQAYILKYRPRAQKECAFYREQPSLAEVVSVATLCEDPSGKYLRHPHQWRVSPAALAQVEQALQRLAPDISRCTTFHELFELVRTTTKTIRGVGADGVTAYDIAHRIGLYRKLRLEPARIYLHNGTRDGARALGLRGPWVCMDTLPREFHALTPAEAEDCLCIFKRELWAISRGV